MNKNKLIKFSQPLIKKDETQEVLKTLKSGWLTKGKKN